jgi:hypothetical protein
MRSSCAKVAANCTFEVHSTQSTATGSKRGRGHHTDRRWGPQTSQFAQACSLSRLRGAREGARPRPSEIARCDPPCRVGKVALFARRATRSGSIYRQTSRGHGAIARDDGRKRPDARRSTLRSFPRTRESSLCQIAARLMLAKAGSPLAGESREGARPRHQRNRTWPTSNAAAMTIARLMAPSVSCRKRATFFVVGETRQIRDVTEL